MIRIWKFSDAPAHLKQLTAQESECDWVLEIPKAMMPEVAVVLGDASESITVLSSQEIRPGTVIVFAQTRKSMISATLHDDRRGF